MSDFMEALVDLLPDHSALKDSSNELRKVLDKTVGAFCDDYDVLDFYDQLFLNSARGGYLDLFGRDYGVSRRVDEDDESYRERIIFEKLEYLTAHNLQSIYNVGLFNCFDGFNPVDNDLTSDNPYMTDWFVGVADEDTQDIVNKKFILDDSVVWYNNGEELDYIFNTSDVGMLKQYQGVYINPDLRFYFASNNGIESVKLDLPNCLDARGLFDSHSTIVSADLNLPNCEYIKGMFKDSNINSVKIINSNSKDITYCFYGCTNLVNAEVYASKVNTAKYLFEGCSSLKNVKLELPRLLVNFNNQTKYFFKGCSALESIDIVIPNGLVNTFKSYVLGLNLSNLTTFIINGEEVDLS